MFILFVVNSFNGYLGFVRQTEARPPTLVSGGSPRALRPHIPRNPQPADNNRPTNNRSEHGSSTRSSSRPASSRPEPPGRASSQEGVEDGTETQRTTTSLEEEASVDDSPEPEVWNITAPMV